MNRMGLGESALTWPSVTAAAAHVPSRERRRGRGGWSPRSRRPAWSARLTLALHYRDPHTQGSWGFCPVPRLTGLDCPGCGGLRAVNDLTNLDLAGAASSNLLLVLVMPVLVVVCGWPGYAGPGGPPAAARVGVPPDAVGAGRARVVIAIFTVARNLPVGGWLAA